MQQGTIFYLGLGSNLGDRGQHLRATLTALQTLLNQQWAGLATAPLNNSSHAPPSRLICAPWFESAPVGTGASGGAYWNTVVMGRWPVAADAGASHLAPHLTQDALTLLGHLQAMEAQQGRDRTQETARNQARTLDLDLLLFGDLVLDSARLSLPHPRLHQRAFVLRPLLDLTPDLILPQLGAARDYLASVADQTLTPLALDVADFINK